ncbi:MAG: hypothetical protein PHP95_09010 [Desulfuromonadaceae bacterium]|nr:hypothetical protein [Desulfuromonadaceae bacterium]MDD2848582.1 hypothetical protein [Desulfuromonadaceae bacterium]
MLDHAPKRQLTADKDGYTPIKPGSTSKRRITLRVKPAFFQGFYFSALIGGKRLGLCSNPKFKIYLGPLGLNSKSASSE